jgi:hypothetical protein
MNKMTIDDIAATSTFQWLRRRNLTPSTWGLNEDRKKQILGANLLITIMRSPASCLRLPNNPSIRHIIIIDPVPLERNQFTREEQIATILHEIGHVVNPPPNNPPPNTMANYVTSLAGDNPDEFHADDYALQCNYGAHLSSALRKIVSSTDQADISDNDRQAINRRINRLNDSINQSPPN